MPWIEKYRPKNFSEIVGQDMIVQKIKAFMKYYGTGKKAIILYGPPGVGKTTIAYATAKELDAEIFELNASDLRNKEKMRNVLRPAIEQRSLTKKRKIILVDEVDGISTVDRGGLTELLSLIGTTKYPIIITANDVWNRKLSDLRKKTEIVQLKEANYEDIIKVLEKILEKEDLFLNLNIIKSIAIRAKGDLRAAINDLQTVSRLQDPSIITLDERNKEIDIFNALRTIFKKKTDKEILKIFDSVNLSTDEIILWVEENIPEEFQGEDLARAYDLLSKVDIFKGRIYKQQYWRFLVYEIAFLTFGMSSIKDKRKNESEFTKYKKPTRILKIWLNNQRTMKKKSIAQKYARYVHIGQKRAMNEFPIIKQIIKSNKDISKELKLTEDEMTYLMK